MSRKTHYPLFVLGFASALGIGWLIRKQREKPLYLRVWQGALARRYGAEKTQEVIAAVQAENSSLAAQTPAPESKFLRYHLFDNILPGLALYRVLLNEHAGDKTAALAGVDDALRAWTEAQSRIVFAPLKVMPAPFQVFKQVLGPMMKIYPSEAWDFASVENSDDRIAFNATRCYYLNTLTALGAPELTASFCKTDDVMAEQFPPSILFIRDHTLGRGDEMCNFQYCRVRKS